MTEQEDALGDLGQAGVLGGMLWAWSSARRQALLSYDSDTGHDQAWVGYSAYKLYLDRLNRVFSCDRFTLAAGAATNAGDDVVAAGLQPGEHKAMPHIEPMLVVRDDLNGSPGWRHKEWRFLLQSFGGVAIDHIPWPQKGMTKKRVASQPTPDEPVIPGFEQLMAINVLDLSDDDAPGKIKISTLVAAYAIDAHTGDSELYLGRPRYNKGGTEAWHWRVRLDDGKRDGGHGVKPMTPTPTNPAPQNVEDAEVRLRPASKEAGSRKDGG